MFDYLSPRNGPVIDGLESQEVVYAKDQPKYIPLRTLKSRSPQGAVLSRWTLTPEQRKAVTEGADIFLELLTFHRPLQPIRIAIGKGDLDTAWMDTCPADEPEKLSNIEVIQEAASAEN
jgi:hypothetical protein